MSNKEVIDYLLNHIEIVNGAKNKKIVVKTNPVTVRIDQPLKDYNATLFCFLAFLVGYITLSCF